VPPRRLRRVPCFVGKPTGHPNGGIEIPRLISTKLKRKKLPFRIYLDRAEPAGVCKVAEIAIDEGKCCEGLAVVGNVRHDLVEQLIWQAEHASA